MPRSASTASRPDAHPDTHPDRQPAPAPQSGEPKSAAIPSSRPRRTSRAARAAAPPIPLGSLTQISCRDGVHCQACGSERVTSLAMTLTDGTPVQFQSCHRCEERAWLDLDGVPIEVDSVLDKARKIR